MPTTEKNEESKPDSACPGHDRFGQAPERGDAEHVLLVRVDRNAVEPLADQVAEHSERGPALRRGCADHRDATCGSKDVRDLLVVGQRYRASAFLSVEDVDRPTPLFARNTAPFGLIGLVGRQVAPSLTYALPSAFGGMLRPTTPARTMIVRT
jgi:hypothetical protein